ncbi:MAG TPA: hypothetical protein ENN19_15465, partial [Chloroflexi bacterium]|nr:hypothetical protein [Chloroflexota bacterium]
MGQKKKLEAGLDDLFSQRSHRDSDSPARVTPDPEAASEAIEEHSDTSAIPSKASVDVEVIRVEDKDPGQRDIPSTDVAPVESDLEDVDIETEIEDADADAEIVEEVITKRPEKIVKQAVDPPVEFEDEGSQQRQL